MTEHNPFTPTFGTVPPIMAGRDQMLRDMKRAFESGPGNPNLSSILIGARGTGKTAMLSCIADEAHAQGWLSVDAVASPGMLEDILQHAAKAAAHLVEAQPKRHLSALGIAKVLDVAWVFERPEEANWRSRIEALVEALERRGTGLLITVDEVRADVDELIELVTVYQLLVRHGHRVALVMAGLPAHTTDLIDDKRVSFLRRARQHHLGRIGDRDVRAALARTVRAAGGDIDEDALDIAVRAANGFAYMMQLVGYFAWEASLGSTHITRTHAEQGAHAAEADFRHGVLESTYREMSPGDRAFALAMCPDTHGSTLSTVAKRMGKSTSYASTYKRRLLKQGVIGPREGKTFDFDIPLMRSYLTDMVEREL